MKKLILIALTLVSAMANAQTISATKVPATVKAYFAKAHPSVKAKWELENGLYEASFTVNKLQLSELYTKTGALAEREAAISISELPSPVLPYIKSHYKATAVKAASRITKGSGEVNYEAAIKGKDLIFNSTGAFLKEVVE